MTVHAESTTEADAIYGPLSPDEWPDIEHLVTEDDTPVDNIFSAKNQRLLVEPLYTSWSGSTETGVFLADANVGVFYSIYAPALVPDAFLSLDVEAPDEWWEKRHRSYFIWEYGKPPEVAIEIVSNRKGREADYKLREYARIRILYYIIFDPSGQLGSDMLQIYELRGNTYSLLDSGWLEHVGLGLRLWPGMFEGKHATWLRWCDQEGTVVPTGAEQAAQERDRAAHAEQRADQERGRAAHAEQRADQERDRADQERDRADQERDRAERLAARLRELGIDPDR